MKDLKIKDGNVRYQMIAGGSMVLGSMPVAPARWMIKTGFSEESDRIPGFEIVVDGKYFFETESEAPRKRRVRKNVEA